MDANRTIYCRAEIHPENELQLSGTVIRYGDVAVLPFGKEIIDAGAFGDVASSDVILNRQHDRGKPLARTGEGGGLALVDSPVELRLQADLPETDTAREAITLVRSGVLRGFSVEFRALSEYTRDRILHVESAQLVGVALVDRPAYPDSQVLRHQEIAVPVDDADGLTDWQYVIQRGGF